MKEAQFDAIIFDMDGTLWDGVECYAQGFNDFFRKNRIKRKFTKHDLYSLMGLEEEQYLKITLPEFSADERKTMYEEIIEYQYKRIETDGGVLFEGVKSGLAELSKKYKLFIVSNCPEFTIDYFVKWAGIGRYITDTMAHGQNFEPKHENIKHIISKHKLQSPIYVGDTDSDRKQSELANVPFAFVEYGFGNAEAYAFSFASFNALADYFLA